MFETISVFDSMELDNTQQRVASRRALALAHSRVERNLGSFLRAAQTEDEFLERLALVQDDFDGYIVTASNESDHDKPEHIAAALKDHYRLAARPVEFVKTPEEEEKEEEAEEEAKTSRWGIISVEGKQGSPLAEGPYPAGHDPLDEWDLQDAPRGMHPFLDQQGWDAPNAQDPIRGPEGYIRNGVPKDVAHDEGYENIPYVVDPNAPDPQSQRDYGNDQGLQIQPNLPGVEVPPRYPNRYQGANNPSDQRSNEHEQVTCPECGGDGKQAGVNRCGKCKGAGKVPNFGDSLLDATFEAKTAIAIDDMPMMQPQQNAQPQQMSMPPAGTPEYEQWIQQQRQQMQQLVTVPQGAKINYDNNRQMPPGWKGPDSGDPNYLQNRQNDLQNRQAADNQNNTGLDGPEPEMDKRKWTPETVKMPDQVELKGEDGHENKDITEPIKATNDSPLKEIGEYKTERESLPSNSGDAGFNTGGEDFGAHTDTFGNDGQTDPVTREAISHQRSENPLAQMLLEPLPSDQIVEAAFKRFKD